MTASGGAADSRDSGDVGDAAPPPHAEVTPVDTDGVRTVLVGTVLWAVALVVLLVVREDLDASGRGWWVWTAVAGLGLGLLGYEYTRRRRDAIVRVRGYRAEAESDLGEDQNGRSASDS